MTEFTLRLKIPNAGNKEIYYSVNLTGTDSSHPEDFFSSRTDRGKGNRLNLSQAIENQSLRQVTDEQLEQIIHKWNHGIKNGKSNTTTVEISLEPYGGSSPPTPPVVQPIPPVVKPIAPVVQPPPGGMGPKPPVAPRSKNPQPPITQPVEPRINPPGSENPPVSPEPSPPSVDIRKIDNKADF